MYFNPAMQQQFSRSNPALYWPGLQGLVTNPLAWRDRLGAAHSESTKYIFYNYLLKKSPRATYKIYFECVRVLSSLVTSDALLTRTRSKSDTPSKTISAIARLHAYTSLSLCASHALDVLNEINTYCKHQVPISP